jgi:hypothetical protein
MVLRRIIALILTLTVCLAYIPTAAAQDLPETLFVESGGQTFRLDLTDFLANYEKVATGTGTFQVMMSRAALHGAREWTEVVEYTFTSTEAAYSTSYRVGPDTFTMTVPKVVLQRSAKDLPPNTAATIEVNGVVEYLDMATFHELAAHMSITGEIPESYDLPQSLSNLALEFEDLTQLIDGYQEFQSAARRLKNHTLHVATKDDSCAKPCVSCAAMLLANIGTAAAVIAACGSAVATGGATVAACIAAFIAHNVTHFMTLGVCADCYLCVTEPEPVVCPCAGQPDCDCD